MKMAVVPKERLNRLLKKHGASSEVGHVILAYETIFEAVCDPKSSSLELKPLDMLIFCPHCGKQHIDKPEPEMCKCGHHLTRHDDSALHSCTVPGSSSATTEHYRGASICKCLSFTVAWDNPPHKSHTCRSDYGGCGKIFRIADVPTNGVAEVKTRGKDDTWPKVQE